MIEEMVVLVDQTDQAIGQMEKMEAHLKGLLHRAFSVFIFDQDGRLLLQQRDQRKYHSGGLWTNTCCSHPRVGEPIQEAAARRLQEEMGMTCALTHAFSFVYHADLGELSEHEYDHVLVGYSSATPQPDPEEVMAYKWVSLEALEEWLAAEPASFTAWFKIIGPRLQELRDLALNAYC